MNFIIKMDDSARIYAEPLEQTNVRIECESSYGREINGWIITDESGNRFIYRQRSGPLILSRRMRSVLTVSVINHIFLLGI